METKTKTVKVLLNLGHEFLPVFGEPLPAQDEIHEMDEERANMLLARGLAREHDPVVEEQLHHEATRLERERLEQVAKQQEEQEAARAGKPVRRRRPVPEPVVEPAPAPVVEPEPAPESTTDL